MSQARSPLLKGKKSGGRGSQGLAAGIKNLSQLTGNQALLAMLARKRGTSDKTELDLSTDGVETEDPVKDKEVALAALRLLLDSSEDVIGEVDSENDPNKAFGKLKHHVVELLAALHLSLDGDEGYDGSLLEELEKLQGLDDNAGEHRAGALAELLQALLKEGEGLHKTLVDRLESGPDGGGSLQELEKLTQEIKKLREHVENDEPTQKKRHELAKAAGAGAAGAGGGAGALELLEKKKKKKKRP